MSVPCNSSRILEGKDSKYGVTLCLWYDCPEKKNSFCGLQEMEAFIQNPLNSSRVWRCWPQKVFHCWIGAVLANQQEEGKQRMYGCIVFTQCLGVEHAAPDCITSLVFISIGVVTESQGGLGQKGS